MNRIELLEQLFYPFAVVLSIKEWAAAALMLVVCWFVANRYLRLSPFLSPPRILWQLIMALTTAAVVLASLLLLLSPYGPERYRFIFSLFVVTPLIGATAICFFFKPKQGDLQKL